MAEQTRAAPLPEPEDPSRRRFLERMSLALGGVIAALLGAPLVGYLLAPLIKSPQPQWIDLGAVGSYEIGNTTLAAFEDLSPQPWAGLTAQTAVYVRRTAEQEFTVFAVNCTHLGCPVNWLPTAQIFVCPCHGGVFYRDGDVAAGPPQRPLYRYRTRLEGGHLLVQTQPLPPAGPPIVAQRDGDPRA